VHAATYQVQRLAAKHNEAGLCLHESAQVAYPFRPLKDGEQLELGQLRLRVLHTPGHRPELISLLIINPPRSPEPSIVLTGDSLLVGDVGRPNFGGGDATTQYYSVTRLLRLPDWVAVFPGHFEGPCGKGMCGRPSTAIGPERLYNLLLYLERGPFVSSFTNAVPVRPLNMTAIQATNRGLSDMPQAVLTTAPDVMEIDVEALERRSTDAIVLDVREPEEYAHRRVRSWTRARGSKPTTGRACLEAGRLTTRWRLDDKPPKRVSLAAGSAVSQADGFRSGGERQRWHRGLARKRANALALMTSAAPRSPE